MRDLLEECISDLGQHEKDYKAFQETFCARCRNSECIHAQKANDAFTQRVKTQVDRLFNPPEVASNKDPKYAQIDDFVDLLEYASAYSVQGTPPAENKTPPLILTTKTDNNTPAPARGIILPGPASVGINHDPWAVTTGSDRVVGKGAVIVLGDSDNGTK